MESKELDELLDSFDRQAGLVKEKLTDLLATVSAGRIPGAGNLRSFQDTMDALVSAYGALKAEARGSLSEGEMPEEGCAASDYVAAIRSSRGRFLKLQAEKARAVLTSFLKVQSPIAEYETALSPFRARAAEVLRGLSEENIEDQAEETKAPELFLRALELEHINGSEGFCILEEINRYYPVQVQWGLAGGQYFIGEEPEGPGEVPGEEKAGDGRKGAGTDVLTAVNRVKTGTPSASAFKKEFIKMARINPSVCAILPMMTNFGVLNREQIYFMGICLYVFGEFDRGRAVVDIAIDMLVEKGYLACFHHEQNGLVSEAYCLSEYCHGCLMKDSIMKSGLFELGDEYGAVMVSTVEVASSGDIKKSTVDMFIRNNNRLTEYLYAEKGLRELGDYEAIVNSAIWKEDHYQVAVVMDGEVTCCRLYDPDGTPPGEIEEDGILWVGDAAGISSDMKDRYGKIFVYHNHSVSRIGETPDAAEEQENVREEAEDVIKEEDVAGTGEVSVESLAGKDTVPTDEEFCALIRGLLDGEVAGREQLAPLISQVAVFAKAVGDVAAEDHGSYPESWKLSAQVRLATNLMMDDDCAYTSECLSTVFADPVNEDPALMLSAYLFAMLVPGRAFDYGIRNQTGLFLERFEAYFGPFASFRPLFNQLMGAKDIAAAGFSPGIVSLPGDEAESENDMGSHQQDIARLKSLRAGIMKLIRKTQKDAAWKGHKNANVLMWALSYMRQYLNGQAVRLKIYADFLYTGILSVGGDGVPVIDPDLVRVRYYEPWRNVLVHMRSPRKPAGDVKAEILGDRLDDKADEEGLKDNLRQLEMLGRLLGEKGEDYRITEGQRKDAMASADDRATRFQERLELAYTYKQISETEKENLTGIVNQYRPGFYASGDFACWRRFLEALERQIMEFARGRQRQLRARLEDHLGKNRESSLLKEAGRLLEQEMNLAVAEEYMNRFEAGETDPDHGALLQDIDYFSDFLDPGNFDPLLQECRRCNGKSPGQFGWAYVERHMPEGWTSRQKEDCRNLLAGWPKRKGAATPAQIRKLFTGLGFDVISAERAAAGKEEVFRIRVRQAARGMADYRHPIAAFGTQMKSPINAIMLFGNYTGKQLVDTVSSLDFGGISIVLLDRPVDAASRRLIGEIFHTQTSRQNPFLLIDQVLFLYLALHQITERMPAMLKCTLPYSAYQPFVRDGGPTSDEMFCGRAQELAAIMDPNGACVVYGGRQLGKTALLERAESRCSRPGNRAFAVYTTIIRIRDEKEVAETIASDINKKVDGKITLPPCHSIKGLCAALSGLFRTKQVVSMLLLIDEVDDFLVSIAEDAYRPLQPFVDLRRETKNHFKFVIAGLHNVCRAKNATRENGIFGQLGTPLCIKPLAPADALQLISRPLRYLGFRLDLYPHLETILTNTNYYPGILQFFGYMLVETLTGQYARYYRAADGNPPFTLQDEQLGAVMNSSDLNKSIRDKFRWSLELDRRYFMLARCITMLYHYYEEDRKAGSWQGFPVEEIMGMAREYDIHCLEGESRDDYVNLLDEMAEMGILGKPDGNRGIYRLRRNSFVDIIGENFDVLEADIIHNNEEA